MPTRLVTTNDPATALAMAVLTAFVFLAVVRFADLNEREPTWALATLFGLGTAFGLVIGFAVPSTTLTLDLWWSAFFQQLAVLAALGSGITVLESVGRLRGWSEVNGALDGMIYGVAAGLGVVTGRSFVEQLTGASVGLGVSAWELWFAISLSGLAFLVYGAIQGIAFGLALDREDRGSRIGLPLVGFVLAIVAQAIIMYLRTGNSLAGGTGQALKWVGLLLPVLALAGFVVMALLREQRSIAEELADEAEAGVVSPEDLRLLRNVVQRRTRYVQHLFRGDLDLWTFERELHNRQVQLALVERRLRRVTDPDRQRRLRAEADHLRGSVLEHKLAMGDRSTVPATTGGQA